MRLKQVLLLIWSLCAILSSIKAQSINPYIYWNKRISKVYGITQNQGNLYALLEVNSDVESYVNLVIKIDSGLNKGVVIQKLSNSISSQILSSETSAIFLSEVGDMKNAYNAQFTLFDSAGMINGPFIIGDSANDPGGIILLNNVAYISGSYHGMPFPGYGTMEYGFLGCYTLNGQKIWENYNRSDWHGFKTSNFEKVFYTRNHQLLAIGYAGYDSLARRMQRRIVTALFDTLGNMIQGNSELDSLGYAFDRTYNRSTLPFWDYNIITQINDSSYVAMAYDQRNLSPTYWVFFDELGYVTKYRKPWMYRDTINHKEKFDYLASGLIRKRFGDGYFMVGYNDSIQSPVLVELDDELFLKRLFPLPPQINTKNMRAVIKAFHENEDGTIYTLNWFEIDSLNGAYTNGAMVCKIDSNGNLLSNGPVVATGGTELMHTDIKVYPNPFKNAIFIERETAVNTQVELYTLYGQKVLSRNLQGSGQLDTEMLALGYYLLLLTDEEGRKSGYKFLKTGEFR